MDYYNSYQEVLMPQGKLPVRARWTQAGIVAVGLAMFVGQVGWPLRDPWDPTAAARWVGLLAPVFFMWAIWSAASVLVGVRCGEAFGATMVRGLSRIGIGLLLGTFCAVFVQPSFVNLIDNRFAGMRGVKFDYTVENLTLALVGLLLVLLAQAGRGLKSELDQIV